MTGDERDRFSHYRAWMARLGFRPSRRLGQNFLLDPTLHRFIADSVAVGERDLVLEVGAGLGFLTRELAERAGHVVAVEIDTRLQQIVRAELDAALASGRVELVGGDVLERGALSPSVVAALADRRGLERFLVVANVPYAIVGPLVASLVTSDLAVPDAMSLLVPADFAGRLAAAAGSSEYGALSVTAQAFGRVEVVRRVGREVFRPRPNVESALVRFTRHAGRLGQDASAARREFVAFVRALFELRRKTLKHAMARAACVLGFEPEVAQRELAGHDLAGRRAQALAPNEIEGLWRKLSRVLDS